MVLKRRLKICHLGKYYPPAPGGIETHVQTLARAQAELGADVRVVCINHMNRAGRDITWFRYGATRTVHEHDDKVRVTRLGRSASVARLDLIPGLPRLLMDLQGSDIDVLHLHTPNPTMMIAVASLRLSIPLVVTHHSDIIRQRVLRQMFRPFEKVVYARATTIFTSSESYAHGSNILLEHQDKVQLLPMGLDLDAFTHPSPRALETADKTKREIGDGGNSPIWLCVGRFVYYKGLATAIEALQHVPGKLILIGNGPMENDLRALAEKVGVSDRIVWKGYASQDELVGAYRAATALWFPSSHKSEAFGLVQVEAMASGCPVINTHIHGSGVSWVSPHEVTGLTVKINDPVAFANAARRLIDEPDLRGRLSNAARQRATAEFNHRIMAERSLLAYRRAVTSVRGRFVAEQQEELKLRKWVRNLAAHAAQATHVGEPHASLASVRGEPLRRD